MSYKQTHTQQTTFWSFIRNCKIEIPIIQRDYAQGRVGKEKLRETFLKSLKGALDSETKLTLDFVYGSVETNNLNPLDGQQRLTTLWLLHWYIAYKAGKLSENRDIFKQFSYETRTSSREFCIKLSEFSEKDSSQIVALIQKQTWFLSAWKQDPTIQAMLYMLGGTTVKDKDQNEIIDGVEELFVECKTADYLKYWEMLTDNNCPISFYYLNLHDVGLSDDLYIKMNARGKALTHFENFKADLVGYIKDLKSEKSKEKPQDTIAHKLDTTWTDIFWKFRSSENKIDEVYYEFIHRFMLNGLVTAKDVDNKYLYPQKELVEQKLYKYIYNSSYRNYTGFDQYATADSFLIDIFARLEKIMDHFYNSFNQKSRKDINVLFSSSWGAEFSFIPESEKEDNIGITLPQRVLLYAASNYFEWGEYEIISWNHWMRVVWNIVENGNVNDEESMIGAIRLIDEMAKYSHSLYEFIVENELTSIFAKEQMEEERDKINKIRGEKGEDWEIVILKAEGLAFFKGKISTLLKASRGDLDRFKDLLELCEKKIKTNDESLFKDYLTHIQVDNLPINCRISSFNDWKKLLTDNRASGAAVRFLESNLTVNTDKTDWPEWKGILIDDFEDLKSVEGRVSAYNRGNYGENDVFIYINSNITSARLLSKIRKTLIEQLIAKGFVKKDYPLYPGSNDCGNLWILHSFFTEEFKSHIYTCAYRPEYVSFLINAKSLYLRILQNGERKYFEKFDINEKSIETFLNC